MRYEVGYGLSGQFFTTEKNVSVRMVLPNGTDGAEGGASVEFALNHPIGCDCLEVVARARKKEWELSHGSEQEPFRAVIVTSDITRPMPSAEVLPAILKRLYMAEIGQDEITIVFATGSHRKHTEEEKRKLIGNRIYEKVACRDSAEGPFVHLGTTGAGTPVDIMEAVAQADLRICIGNIEYHYFAGYSGGVKAIMPGTSTKEAIAVNHARMIDERAAVGILDGNPVRMDLEEAVASYCPAHFLLNVVLDEHKRIVHAVAGDAVLSHRAGCAFLDRMYQVRIGRRADIVIASQGGYPKDLNLYQTQKALANAAFAVREGGTIILAGACTEGMGEKTFAEWMREAEKPEDLTARVERDFQLGGHKAAAVAAVLAHAEICLVSEMEDELVRSIFLRPYHHVQDALGYALRKHGTGADILFMPYAGSTLPVAE